MADPKGFTYDTRLNLQYAPLEDIDVPGLVAACKVPLYNVASGRLLIDLRDRTIDLAPGHGCVIPKGVEHRPRAPERTAMLMVEGAGIADDARWSDSAGALVRD